MKWHFPYVKHCIALNYTDNTHSLVFASIAIILYIKLECISLLYLQYTNMHSHTNTHTQHQNMKSNLGYNELARNFITSFSTLQLFS